MTRISKLLSAEDIIKTFTKLAARGDTGSQSWANAFGYSNPTIVAVCREHFGLKAHDVFRSVMLDVARDFAMHTNWSVELIANRFNLSYRVMNEMYREKFGENMTDSRSRANKVLYKTLERPAARKFTITPEDLDSLILDSVLEGRSTVKLISIKADCSPVTIQKYCKLIKGIDISEAVSQCRAMFIRAAILHSNLTLEDVAMRLGITRRCARMIYKDAFGVTTLDDRKNFGTRIFGSRNVPANQSHA